jgi:hypothetical protein
LYCPLYCVGLCLLQEYCDLGTLHHVVRLIHKVL